MGDLVGGGRFDPAVVNREGFKISQNAQGQLGAPAIAPQLVGRVDVFGNIDRGLFGFQEKLARPADAEAVIRGLGDAADLDGVLVDDVLVGFGIAVFVGDVPAQGLEKGVDELPAHLGFVVGAFFVGVQVVVKGVDQFFDTVGCGHEGLSTDWRG